MPRLGRSARPRSTDLAHRTAQSLARSGAASAAWAAPCFRGQSARSALARPSDRHRTAKCSRIALCTTVQSAHEARADPESRHFAAQFRSGRLTPMHDDLRGANVIQTIGALHRVQRRSVWPRSTGARGASGRLAAPFRRRADRGCERRLSLRRRRGARSATDLARHDPRAWGVACSSRLRGAPARRILPSCATHFVGTPAFVGTERAQIPISAFWALADMILVTADS